MKGGGEGRGGGRFVGTSEDRWTDATRATRVEGSGKWADAMDNLYSK